MGASPKRNVALVETMTLPRRSLDGGPEDALGFAGGINVGAIEHRDAGLEADVDEAPRALLVGRAPGLEEFALAAERSAAVAQNRHGKARCAQSPIFHAHLHELTRTLSETARLPR